MQRTFARCLVLSCFLFGVSAWPQEWKPPVCIIGAGPAGLMAANNLESKGYKAVIFDKQPKIGGKCQAYYENGIFHPMGAAFYSNASYPETLKVINDVSVSSAPFSLAGGGRQQFEFNFTTGMTEPVAPPSAGFEQLLAAEIPKYIGLWYQEFAPYSVPSFKNGVPQNLTVPADQWFATNGFVALPIALTNPEALYGYGDIRQVPILYILQYINPDILTAFVGQHDVYYIDFHKVWVEWVQKNIKSPILTNTEITCIDRSGPGPILKYIVQEPYSYHFREHEQACSSVIMAFPPTLSNLEAAGLDITPEETEVFVEVGVENYYSSATKLDVPYGVSYFAENAAPGIPPPSDGQPVALLVLNSASPIATTWSWGPYRQYQSINDAYALLQSTLSKINRDPRNATTMSVAVTLADIREFRKWDYFPHFDSPALANGSYAKLNALQGCKNTYWASGLNGMELVEWAIRAGQDVVNSYF